MDKGGAMQDLSATPSGSIMKPVVLKLDDGTSLVTHPDNLTSSGLVLDGAPRTWCAGQPVQFRLSVGPARLRLKGTVSWRRGDAVNVVLASKSSHVMR